MVLLVLILISPLAIIVAAVAGTTLKHLRLLPSQIPALLMGAILFCTGLGSLLLFVTLDSFVSQPARLQEELIGRQVGYPWTLESYETAGFQDPFQIWTYRLSPADAFMLRRQCKPDPRPRSRRCSLGGRGDERYYSGASLERNILQLEEGLW